MSESADENEPVRIPDHDLDDLVSTVSGLVAETRKQGETLALLTDELPCSQEGEEEQPCRGTTRGSDGGVGQVEGGSAFILALAGTVYAKELAALKVWVDDLLLPVYGREITSTRPWCAQWTEHPEAVARLHALWLAWQQFTDTEAGLAGPSMWHRDHLDPTMLQLRASDGPFSACTTSPTRPNHRLLSAPDPSANRQAA
ncbi:DUF4913 domain-containing protein [Streptomyces sp. RTd22]|uniref:DUF4913 domain-containing protein n=1 Tax=Streptomyces sp. RTd22 TaxID=1841249 RepID=UPI0007C4D239|nr:DUF4913 domain-containing protein [Streptomyces sp. RTd22]